jgi:hypothetical protein
MHECEQVDDSNGKSNKAMNVIAMDMNTRTWRELKAFKLQGKATGGV